ncbi:solute carrier family 25 member 43 isoform X1 [Salmo salar]|uniref:Solute carrier family 25 member 43 n=1 Tax=Salmo salar TaxID=8030 RepID=A0A1S3RS91_SALSA|nr:solute carrier family 25 member 43 isoform X1 [Salmo salar]|eukprot:XP_014055143.1 PREDICTED: solute carrier family 25 member 43-like isoform X2 [Salmo salar]
MATVKQDDRLTSSQGFMCVGFAGVFSKTVTSPLEVVKIKSQVGTFHCKKGFLHSFLVVYQKEGIRGFWKGNLVSCLRLFPYSAVHLATYKQIVHLHMDELGYVSQWRAIFAGGLAGIGAALATYPLEVAETRLIAQNCREPTYRGVVHTLSKIYQTEGLQALYRGFSLTILGAFPFSIGCYAVYINLDKLWREPQFRFTALQNFINGCIAAGVAQTLSYPFETVKRKMQAQNPQLPHYGGADIHFTGMLDCFRQVIRNKGILTLWSGITANMVKIVPYFGLLFSCFEMCKQVCLYRNGYIVSPLSYKLAPGVDQSMGPTEVEEVKRYLKNRKFQSQQGSRW